MKNHRSLEEAFLYATECNLATVEHLATRKIRPKNEFARQISIAQTMINDIRSLEISTTSSRISQIIETFNADVQSWANHLIQKFHNS